MNQDLKSRIPVAILYVVAITAMTLYGSISSAILLAIFMGLSLSEFLKAEHKISTINISIISLILISGIAILAGPFGGWILPVLTYTSCLFFISSIIYLVSYKTVIFQKVPTLLAGILYLGRAHRRRHHRYAHIIVTTQCLTGT